MKLIFVTAICIVLPAFPAYLLFRVLRLGSEKKLAAVAEGVASLVAILGPAILVFWIIFQNHFEPENSEQKLVAGVSIIAAYVSWRISKAVFGRPI